MPVIESGCPLASVRSSPEEADGGRLESFAEERADERSFSSLRI
jgi:hypothetical protein